MISKTIRIIQSYLMFAFPLVVLCMAWGTWQSQEEVLKSKSDIAKLLLEVLSWNLMVWFAVLVIFLVCLVAMPLARERTLKRLANLKERDEREEYVTGKASRATYISTLSLLILFLFLSVFELNLTRLPKEQVFNGKQKNLSIGFHFNLLDKAKTEKNSEGEILFESKDIPLSKSAIVLILILWQVLSFNISARKELMVGG